MSIETTSSGVQVSRCLFSYGCTLCLAAHICSVTSRVVDLCTRGSTIQSHHCRYSLPASYLCSNFHVHVYTCIAQHATTLRGRPTLTLIDTPSFPSVHFALCQYSFSFLFTHVPRTCRPLNLRFPEQPPCLRHLFFVGSASSSPSHKYACSPWLWRRCYLQRSRPVMFGGAACPFAAVQELVRVGNVSSSALC